MLKTIRPFVVAFGIVVPYGLFIYFIQPYRFWKPTVYRLKGLILDQKYFNDGSFHEEVALLASSKVSDETIDVLCELVRHSDPDVRSYSIVALGSLARKHDKGRRCLSNAIANDPNGSVRFNALSSLEEIADREGNYGSSQ